MAAYLTNRNDDCLAALERCYHAYRHRGKRAGAVRAAFWLGFRLASIGQIGPANGWFARCARILEGAADCVECGYVLLPAWNDNWPGRLGQRRRDGDGGGRDRSAVRGRRPGGLRASSARARADPKGRSRGRAHASRRGDGRRRRRRALAPDDRPGILQRHRGLSGGLRPRPRTAVDLGARPVVRGPAADRRLHRFVPGAPRRDPAARRRLARRDHRGRASLRAISAGDRPAASGGGVLPAAEMHRLRGAFAAAEAGYRRASGLGCEPQPGLALLRLAQGAAAAAHAAMRRVLAATADLFCRARLLPAQVEIALAAGDIEGADRACSEFERSPRESDVACRGYRGPSPRARCCWHRERQGRLFRPAPLFEVWQVVGAPYEIARVRRLIGRACRALADDDGAELEFAAARVVFEHLGAMPDLAGLDALTATRSRGRPARADPPRAAGASAGFRRQYQRGHRRRALASQRTVERHLSNIFTKLDLASRTAAAAWLYQHGFVRAPNSMGGITHNLAGAGWVFPPKRGRVPPGRIGAARANGREHFHVGANKAQVRRVIEEIYNRGDLDFVDEVAAGDLVIRIGSEESAAATGSSATSPGFAPGSPTSP